MRLLRFLAGFLLTLALFVPLAFAQGSQQQDVQTLATPQAQQPPQPSGDFLRNPFTQQTAGQSSDAPELKRNPRLRIEIPQSRRRIIQRTGPPPNILSDPGIYLRKSALLGNACGSIVSYNFSPGDNPRLESITTCTPAGIVESRRAKGKDDKPPAPAVIRTSY